MAFVVVVVVVAIIGDVGNLFGYLVRCLVAVFSPFLGHSEFPL